MIYTCTIDTPLGDMTAAAKDEALIGLWFIGQKYYPSETAHWICEPDHPIFMSTTELSRALFFRRSRCARCPARSFTDRLFKKRYGVSFQESRWGTLPPMDKSPDISPRPEA